MISNLVQQKTAGRSPSQPPTAGYSLPSVVQEKIILVTCCSMVPTTYDHPPVAVLYYRRLLVKVTTVA